MRGPHVTVAEYRYLIECKYRNTIKGWALVDHDGGVHAWHEAVPGDSQWATAQSAIKAFLTDTRTRHWRQRLGWTVQEDLDRYWLAAYLTAIRTGVQT